VPCRQTDPVPHPSASQGGAGVAHLEPEPVFATIVSLTLLKVLRNIIGRYTPGSSYESFLGVLEL
jgi:hypothetical protein